MSHQMHRGYSDEYDEFDEYEEEGIEREGSGYEDEEGGEEEEYEEEEPQPTQEELEYLELRQKLKEAARKKIKKETAAVLGNSQEKKKLPQDNYGSFFGPSKPVIAKRVIEERRSIFETQHLLASKNTNLQPGLKKNHASTSSVTKNGASLPPKVVNQTKNRAQTLKDSRDYSFLLSDDVEPPEPVKEPVPHRVSHPSSDARSPPVLQKSGPPMSRTLVNKQPTSKPSMSKAPMRERPMSERPISKQPISRQPTGKPTARPSSNGHLDRNGVSAARPSSNGHLERNGVSASRPSSNGHLERNGVSASRPSSNGHLERNGVSASRPSSSGHVERNGVSAARPLSNGHVERNGLSKSQLLPSKDGQLTKTGVVSRQERLSVDQRKMLGSNAGNGPGRPAAFRSTGQEVAPYAPSNKVNQGSSKLPARVPPKAPLAKTTSLTQKHYSEQKHGAQASERPKSGLKQPMPSAKPQMRPPPKQVATRPKKRLVNRDLDDDDGAYDVSSMIRQMFSYDPSRYRDDDDTSDMEANYHDIQREERRSAKIAREEDERELRLIEEEERREALRRAAKKRKVIQQR